MINCSTPIISIIMGAYNCENTIADAIHSIQKQTLRDWELIICDDNSSDNTKIIIENLASKDKRIVLIKNENNLTLGPTLNKCLSKARGKYIARMDADDECVPARLEKQVLFLENHQNIDCVGSNLIINNGVERKNIRKYPEHPNRYSLMKGVPFAHPSIMMKKSCYDKLEGYNSSESCRGCEDAELWYRFFEANMHGYNIQEGLYIYRETNSDYNRRTLSRALRICSVQLKGFKKLKYSIWRYIYCLKPFISYFIPRNILIFYHNKKDR